MSSQNESLIGGAIALRFEEQYDGAPEVPFEGEQITKTKGRTEQLQCQVCMRDEMFLQFLLSVDL